MRLINTVFMAYLDRAAGPADIAVWKPVVVGPKPSPGVPAPSEQFVAAVLSSPEYVAKNGASSDPVLRSYYTRVLGRQPDATGLALHVQATLDGYTSGRQAEAAAILSSGEYRVNLVAGYYTSYLRRSVGASEMGSWVGQLQQGTSDEQVLDAFVSSDEYYQQAGGTYAKWLDQLYLDLLGRARGTNENAFFDALSNGAPRMQVAAAILSSGEYRQRLIGLYYGHYLGRQGGPGELSSWAARLGGGATDEGISAAILASTEYFQRPHLYP